MKLTYVASCYCEICLETKNAHSHGTKTVTPEAMCLWCGQRFQDRHSHEIDDTKWNGMPDELKTYLLEDPGLPCRKPVGGKSCILPPNHDEACR